MPAAYKCIPVDSSFKTAISPTVRKVLIEYWGNEDIVCQPEIIADIGAESISRINRIGRKSLNDIALALDSYGYIDSPHSWLFKKK
ncbi:MAG: hypothetical protein IME97_01045 [Proteobacteria bacterium]|nr:hypothetical protein [Pseudomonadota bacterium]